MRSRRRAGSFSAQPVASELNCPGGPVPILRLMSPTPGSSSAGLRLRRSKTDPVRRPIPSAPVTQGLLDQSVKSFAGPPLFSLLLTMWTPAPTRSDPCSRGGIAGTAVGSGTGVLREKGTITRSGAAGASTLARARRSRSLRTALSLRRCCRMSGPPCPERLKAPVVGIKGCLDHRLPAARKQHS